MKRKIAMLVFGIKNRRYHLKTKSSCRFYRIITIIKIIHNIYLCRLVYIIKINNFKKLNWKKINIFRENECRTLKKPSRVRISHVPSEKKHILRTICTFAFDSREMNNN